MLSSKLAPKVVRQHENTGVTSALRIWSRQNSGILWSGLHFKCNAFKGNRVAQGTCLQGDQLCCVEKLDEAVSLSQPHMKRHSSYGLGLQKDHFGWSLQSKQGQRLTISSPWITVIASKWDSLSLISFQVHLKYTIRSIFWKHTFVQVALAKIFKPIILRVIKIQKSNMNNYKQYRY